MTRRARLVALLADAGARGLPVAEVAAALGMSAHTLHTVVHQLNTEPSWPCVVGSGPGRGRRGRLWIGWCAPKQPRRYPAGVAGPW